RLDARADRVGMAADEGRGDDLHALVVRPLRIEADVIDDDDDLRWSVALVGVDAEAAGAAGDDGAYVALHLLVGLDGAQGLLHHLVGSPGDLEEDVFGALVEAFDVFGQAEDLAGVDADALEDAVAVEQAVVVDADLRVGLVHEFAVEIDQGHPWTLSIADGR